MGFQRTYGCEALPWDGKFFGFSGQQRFVDISSHFWEEILAKGYIV